MVFFIVGLMMGEDCFDYGVWQLMVIYFVYVDIYIYRFIYYRVFFVEGYKREVQFVSSYFYVLKDLWLQG